MTTSIDTRSFEMNAALDAGPSTSKPPKYCDFTGFPCSYKDKKTGLRYYDKLIFEIVESISEPIKNQYLSMRNALFVIK